MKKFRKPLPPTFFARDTVTVAKELLGKIIAVNGCSARIVETEAYRRDPASHAFKRTPRSSLMFDTYGHVYVYLIYGMYECLNFTTEKVGEPGAVLIRAVEPLAGIGRMKKKRHLLSRKENQQSENLSNLCSGPGKLCQALGITRKLNGMKLGKEMKIFDDRFKVGKIISSSRIGIKEAQALPWRFFIAGNGFVSRIK